MPPTCDIHPDCQSQGCEADPEYCQRAKDIHAARRGNADEAALARMKRFDENKYTRIDAGTGRVKPLVDSDWPNNG